MTGTCERERIPRRQPRLQRDLILEDIEAGHTPLDLARRHNTSLSAVYRTLRRYGQQAPSDVRRRQGADALKQLDQALQRILPTRL